MKEYEFQKMEKVICGAYRVHRAKIDDELNDLNEKLLAKRFGENVFKSKAEYYRTLLWGYTLHRRREEIS